MPEGQCNLSVFPAQLLDSLVQSLVILSALALRLLGADFDGQDAWVHTHGYI